MYYKILFPLIFLPLLGCAVIPKTEVRETPPDEIVIFYSDDGKANEIGCVNIYKLMTASLAAGKAEKVTKRFISEGSRTLDHLRNEINVLEVLTKLQNKIEEMEDTSGEYKEIEKMKYLKEMYPQLYPKLEKELQKDNFPDKDEKINQIKEEYLKFYQQFSLDIQALNYDLLKERREETASIINRLGRKGGFKKIIDSSNGDTSSCQLDMTEEFLNIYDKMVENNYQDFRFYPCSKDKTWEVLISFLKSSGHTFQTIDEEKGIIKTQPVYFKLGEQSTPTKDSAQTNLKEHIDLIAHTPPEKRGMWITSKESLAFQITPFSQTITKIKIRFTIAACDDSEGWEILTSNKLTERNILNSIEKELLARKYISIFKNIFPVYSCAQSSSEHNNL